MRGLLPWAAGAGRPGFCPQAAAARRPCPPSLEQSLGTGLALEGTGSRPFTDPVPEPQAPLTSRRGKGCRRAWAAGASVCAGQGPSTLLAGLGWINGPEPWLGCLALVPCGLWPQAP